MLYLEGRKRVLHVVLKMGAGGSSGMFLPGTGFRCDII
jgi:hypothetical protein